MLPLRKSKIIAHSKLQLPEGRWILLGCCFATGYIQVYKTKWSLQHPSTVMFVGLVAFLGGLWLSPHALQITISVTVCWKTTCRRRLPRRALQGVECQSDCWEIPSSFRGNNIYCGHQSIFIGITISLSIYNYIYIYILLYMYTHSFFWDIWPSFWHLFWLWAEECSTGCGARDMAHSNWNPQSRRAAKGAQQEQRRKVGVGGRVRGRRRGGERGVAPLLKSRDPHLAGGAQLS